jgi:hypothetical protein
MCSLVDVLTDDSEESFASIFRVQEPAWAGADSLSYFVDKLRISTTTPSLVEDHYWNANKIENEGLSDAIPMERENWDVKELLRVRSITSNIPEYDTVYTARWQFGQMTSSWLLYLVTHQGILIAGAIKKDTYRKQEITL